MSETGLRRAIRLLWTAAVVGLIGVLVSGLGAGMRLWLLTVLALLAAPSSLVVVPAANWLIGWLDLDNSRLIDFLVGTASACFGYIQWFVLPVIWKGARGRATFSSRPGAGGNEDRAEAGENGPTVAVFYGDDSECLSLKMMLEGSGIVASLRSFSMSGEGLGRTDVRVCVMHEDVDRARPLVQHFQAQLRNSSKS